MTLTDLTAITTQSVAKSKRPPLELWQPTDIVPFNVHIDSEGVWHHEGRPITRHSLVVLLSSCLWGDYNDKGVLCHYLKTPTHLYQITVADAPFIITQADNINGEIVFTTNVGETITMNDAHVPYFATVDSPKQNHTDLRAYVPIRHHLIAKIARSAFYHLVSFGTLLDESDKTTLLVTCGNRHYAISAAH